MIFALNFLSLDPGRALSGIGNYCVKLLENMHAINVDRQLCIQFHVYIRQGLETHFADEVQSFLHPLPDIEGRLRRVMFEQVMFPRLLRRRKTDLLLNPAFTGPTRGAGRVATVVHDLYFRAVPELLEPRQRRYLQFMVPYTCRRSWRVFTDSKNGVADLLKYYPELGARVVGVPLAGRFDPAPATAPRPAVVPDRPYVLMVANLTGNKNPETAVAAVAAVRASGHDVAMVHVGTDPLGLLEQAVSRHDADVWVTRLRNIDNATLVAVYQNAKCMVVPSIYEGFGLPVLESQQLGLPVIAANTSCLPEVGGNGALYFDPFDHSALADHILRLHDQPDLRSDLWIAVCEMPLFTVGIGRHLRRWTI